VTASPGNVAGKSSRYNVIRVIARTCCVMRNRSPEGAVAGVFPGVQDYRDDALKVVEGTHPVAGSESVRSRKAAAVEPRRRGRCSEAAGRPLHPGATGSLPAEVRVPAGVCIPAAGL